MNLTADIDLGQSLRLRTLTTQDVDLVVEATGAETAPALWGPRPAGPYTHRDAHAALNAWDPDAGRQASYGVVEHGHLLGDTVRHRGAADPPSIPDTGTLRGDLLALLTHANNDRNPMAALVSSMLGSYFNKTGPTVAELRAEFSSQRGSAVEEVVNRAVERGEVDPTASA